MADYKSRVKEEKDGSYHILVPYIVRQRILKNTNKLYLPHRICRSNKVDVIRVSIDREERLPIKKIRTKSIVLKTPVRKNDRIYISYYAWVVGKSITIKAEDYTLVGDGSPSITI